ncbi:hypothetical protein ACVFVO_01720 [Advenella kashmirensis]
MSALRDSVREHAARVGSIDTSVFPEGCWATHCNVTLGGVIINRNGTGTMAHAGARTHRIRQGRHNPAPATYPDIFEQNTIRNQAVGQAGPQT